MVFSNDGTKMVVLGTDGADVNEYTLSTPFDASTLTFVDATSISSQDGPTTRHRVLKRRHQDVRA